MLHRRVVSVGVVSALLGSSAAWAGPDWPEGMNGTGDAGSLPGSAQMVTKNGVLYKITGKLGTTGPGPLDLEDMYLIRINNPGIFCAQTVLVGETSLCCVQKDPVDPALPGTNFNTQLWLFDAEGFGLLGNDNNPMSPPLSLIGRAANDGTISMVVKPGLYYLAISGGPQRDPQSAGGPIFNQASLEEVSGPDGPGGGAPINAWAGNGAQCTECIYEIYFCGATGINAVPSVSEWGMMTLAMVVAGAGAGMIRRMQRPAKPV